MRKLLGRDEDLAQLRAAARESRLVTIVGPVGVGKTELARRLLEGSDREGVEIDLSERTSALGLEAEVARALGVPSSELEAVLAGLDRVLLLDNFEQLVDEGAERVAGWLAASPELRVLVTSRRRLNVSEESAFELAPLSPEHARELFVERARQVDRRYAPDEAERAAIERLCAELDGLPLAIELAAARVSVMSANELADRLADRFEALAKAPRDAHARHATLEDAIASSWSALDPEPRAALAQCALFEGGFDLEAAEAVLSLRSSSVVDALAALVDRSLLVRERIAAQTRFRLLASVRAYARAHGDPAGAAERHAAFYLGRGFRMADRYERRPASEELEWLVREDANLRAVLRRALEGDRPAVALDAALVLQPVLIARGPAELRLRVLDRALAAAGALDPVKVGWARLARGDTLDRLGRPEQARAALEEALALAEGAGDARLTAVASWRLGASLAREDFEAAQARFERALALVREVGDRFHEGRCLGSYGAAALGRGELDRAAALLEEASRAHAEAKDETFRAMTIGLQGRLAHHRGRLDEAVQRLSEAIVALEGIDNRRWLPSLHAQLGLAHLARGALDEAESQHARGRVGAVGPGAAEVALLGALCAEERGERASSEARFSAAAESSDPPVRAAAKLGLLRWRGAGDPPALEPFASYGRATLALAEGGWDDSPLALAPVSPLARDAARRLERALEDAASDALLVGPEARWFRLGGERVDLERRVAPRRILEALAETWADPEHRWTLEALFDRGWPGEKALPKAAASRVYVAISALRKAGLGEAIERDDAGYRLSSALRLLRAAR